MNNIGEIYLKAFKKCTDTKDIKMMLFFTIMSILSVLNFFLLLDVLWILIFSKILKIVSFIAILCYYALSIVAMPKILKEYIEEDNDKNE